MLPSRISVVILILLNICAIYAEDASVITEEGRVNRNLLPLNFKDKSLCTYFTDNDTVITSCSGNSTIEPGKLECTIPGILPPGRNLLGNGKMIAVTYVHSHFTILDYNNCSSYSIIPIDDGKPYAWDNDKEIELVVPYYDTFDIFDRSGQTCLPCRYNDKGEKIEMKNQLTLDERPHRGYFLELTKKDAGENKEYLYGFSFRNETGVVKILDSNYKVLKEHVIDGTILDHSIHGDKIIICYNVPKNRGSTECQILNQDLSTVKTIQMKRPKKDFDSTQLIIANLADGEIMIAIEYFIYNYFGGNNNHKIFIQQIHADGTVEPAIYFGDFKSNYVGIRQFVKENGEFCLVAAVDNKGTGDYSLTKCIVPKTPKKD